MGVFPGVSMVPGGCAPWCGSRGAMNVGLVVLQMFLLALLFIRVDIEFARQVLEKVCVHELALHLGWVSARPPCQPPPVQGRHGSGSLLPGASYRSAGA